jgi:hypothetical protein
MLNYPILSSEGTRLGFMNNRKTIIKYGDPRILKDVEE